MLENRRSEPVSWTPQVRIYGLPDFTITACEWTKLIRSKLMWCDNVRTFLDENVQPLRRTENRAHPLLLPFLPMLSYNLSSCVEFVDLNIQSTLQSYLAISGKIYSVQTVKQCLMFTKINCPCQHFITNLLTDRFHVRIQYSCLLPKLGLL